RGRGGARQGREPVPVERRARQRREGDVEPQAEVTVDRSVDREPGPFEQYRQIGRLLQLDEEDALADRVRKARGNEDPVAGADRHLVQELEQRTLLPLDPSGERG